MSKEISQAVQLLNSEGYKVVSITPITSGNYISNGNITKVVTGPDGEDTVEVYPKGIGFSNTEGVVILAEQYR